jgi:hypothetical protein
MATGEAVEGGGGRRSQGLIIKSRGGFQEQLEGLLAEGAAGLAQVREEETEELALLVDVGTQVIHLEGLLPLLGRVIMQLS